MKTNKINRKKFLRQTIFSVLGLMIAPKIIAEVKTESHLYTASKTADGITEKYIDDKYTGFDFSNIECFYDFTDDKYSIKDKKGNIIGWKDLAGNNHDAFIITANPVYSYKKFAISKKMNESFTDDFAERMLKS